MGHDVHCNFQFEHCGSSPTTPAYGQTELEVLRGTSTLRVNPLPDNTSNRRHPNLLLNRDANPPQAQDTWGTVLVPAAGRGAGSCVLSARARFCSVGAGEIC